jgi:hypothetical protein
MSESNGYTGGCAPLNVLLLVIVLAIFFGLYLLVCLARG